MQEGSRPDRGSPALSCITVVFGQVQVKHLEEDDGMNLITFAGKRLTVGQRFGGPPRPLKDYRKSF